MKKHNHDYNNHEHVFRYCKDCDIVYCMKCDKEWGGVKNTPPVFRASEPYSPPYESWCNPLTRRIHDDKSHIRFPNVKTYF